MPDGTSNAVWEIIKYPILLIVGIMGFNLKRQVSRVDKIEAEHLKKDEFNKTVESFRRDMGKGFDKGREDTQALHKRIDQMILRDK